MLFFTDRACQDPEKCRLKDPDSEGVMVCPESGFRYQEAEPGILKCLDLDEEAPLPDHLTVGAETYDSFKK